MALCSCGHPGKFRFLIFVIRFIVVRRELGKNRDYTHKISFKLIWGKKYQIPWNVFNFTRMTVDGFGKFHVFLWFQCFCLQIGSDTAATKVRNCQGYGCLKLNYLSLSYVSLQKKLNK